MADTTDVLALPFPEGADANDVPADMQALAERLDEVPGIESLTSAEIAALGAALKPAGRVVYNSTTSKLQVSNGTSFADVDAAALASAALKLPLAGGTMSGDIAMGSNKVTGLDAADTNGDAVRYEQLTALGDSVDAIGGTYAVGLRSSDATISVGSWSVVTYTSEAGDAAIIDTSTGVATLTAGAWQVSATAHFAPGSTVLSDQAYALQLRHNTDGVAHTRVNASGNAVVAHFMCVSALIVAGASDTVDLRVYNSTSGSATLSAARLSLVKIGI